MLATLADVKRILRISDTTNDASISSFLEAADEWVHEIYGIEYDLTGSETHTFYEVREGEVLNLPVNDPVVTNVVVYFSAFDPGNQFFISLTPTMNYIVEDHGRVRLFFDRWVAPFEGASARRLPNMYDKVEITFTRSGIIPTPVRDAVAMIAAANYKQSEQIASGVISEGIGDYHYSKSAGRSSVKTSVQTIPDEARRFLRPYRRKPLVRII